MYHEGIQSNILIPSNENGINSVVMLFTISNMVVFVSDFEVNQVREWGLPQSMQYTISQYLRNQSWVKTAVHGGLS